MRLIDADLAQKIADEELFADEAGVVQFVLSHTPTIDPDSLRPKGEWVKDKDGYEHCPFCFEYLPDFTITGDLSAENFCPNCGADMRGEPNAV